MSESRRITVYLDADLHRALRLKSAEVGRPVSDLINSAVLESLSADATDLESVRERAKEPALAFEGVLKELRRRGKL